MKKRTNKKEMYEKIKAWERSGESQTKYFEKQGISRHRYEYWLKNTKQPPRWG